VDNEGKVVEQLLSINHVHETTSEALKVPLVGILDHYKVSIHRI
jgi:hypothetical protein